MSLCVCSRTCVQFCLRDLRPWIHILSSLPHICILGPHPQTENKKMCYRNPALRSLHPPSSRRFIRLSCSRRCAVIGAPDRYQGAGGDRIRDCQGLFALVWCPATQNGAKCLFEISIQSSTSDNFPLWTPVERRALCASCVCVCVRDNVCVSVWVCVLQALILVFRGARLPVPTCVNTAADHMADNDFQIDTLHSSGRENQWALIAFFPRRSSLPEGHYLSLSASVPLSLARTRTNTESHSFCFQ